MTDLTPEQILAADDKVFEPVEVPEWGGTVYIRGMTSAERDRYDRSLVNVDRKGNTTMGRLDNLRALLVVRCLVTKDGQRMFRDPQAKELGEKSALVMNRLWDVASRLSGMNQDREEEEEEVFDGAQDDDTSSG